MTKLEKLNKKLNKLIARRRKLLDLIEPEKRMMAMGCSFLGGVILCAVLGCILGGPIGLLAGLPGGLFAGLGSVPIFALTCILAIESIESKINKIVHNIRDLENIEKQVVQENVSVEDISSEVQTLQSAALIQKLSARKQKKLKKTLDIINNTLEKANGENVDSETIANEQVVTLDL